METKYPPKPVTGGQRRRLEKRLHISDTVSEEKRILLPTPVTPAPLSLLRSEKGGKNKNTDYLQPKLSSLYSKAHRPRAASARAVHLSY